MQALLDRNWITLSWQGALLTVMVFAAIAGLDYFTSRRRRR